MNLRKELQQLSAETEKRLIKEQERAREREASNREKNDKSEAEKILKGLPEKLRRHAQNVSKRECVIFTLQELPPTAKPEQLTGQGKLVFDGCKKMKLDVVVGPHEYDDGMAGVSCAGIFVRW